LSWKLFFLLEKKGVFVFFNFFAESARGAIKKAPEKLYPPATTVRLHDTCRYKCVESGLKRRRGTQDIR